VHVEHRQFSPSQRFKKPDITQSSGATRYSLKSRTFSGVPIGIFSFSRSGPSLWLSRISWDLFRFYSGALISYSIPSYLHTADRRSNFASGGWPLEIHTSIHIDVVTTASEWGIWLTTGEMLQIEHTNNSLFVIKKTLRRFRDIQFASKLNGTGLETCKKPTTAAHLFLPPRFASNDFSEK
jgi:hypothetical protein